MSQFAPNSHPSENRQSGDFIAGRGGGGIWTVEAEKEKTLRPRQKKNYLKNKNQPVLTTLVRIGTGRDHKGALI
jgi:hypothetical protein